MRFTLLLLLLSGCAAVPQDLSGKMFSFPQETDTARVRLNTNKADFQAVSVCLRSFTDLSREHSLFSLSTPSAANSFLIFKKVAPGAIELAAKNIPANFDGQDYKLNTWHSLCATWDSKTGLGQLWLDGRASSRRSLSSGSNIRGATSIILGQEQDSHGGGFVTKQSFVGMMSEVHMWDYVLSPCEIQRYANDLNFTPGTVLNWRALEFSIVGKVLVETKQEGCHSLNL